VIPESASRILKYDADGFDSSATLEQFRAFQVKFANERDWNQFHTPRNLFFATVCFFIVLL